MRADSGRATFLGNGVFWSGLILALSGFIPWVTTGTPGVTLAVVPQPWHWWQPACFRLVFILIVACFFLAVLARGMRSVLLYRAVALAAMSLLAFGTDLVTYAATSGSTFQPAPGYEIISGLWVTLAAGLALAAFALLASAEEKVA